MLWSNTPAVSYCGSFTSGCEARRQLYEAVTCMRTLFDCQHVVLHVACVTYQSHYLQDLPRKCIIRPIPITETVDKCLGTGLPVFSTAKTLTFPLLQFKHLPQLKMLNKMRMVAAIPFHFCSITQTLFGIDFIGTWSMSQNNMLCDIYAETQHHAVTETCMVQFSLTETIICALNNQCNIYNHQE